MGREAVSEEPPVLVVRRRSVLQRLLQRGERGLLARLAPEERALLQLAHREHEASCEAAFETLRAMGVPWEEVEEPTEERCAGARLLLTLGGDGTLLRASHAVPPGVPVLAINTSPSTSVGHFAAAAGPAPAREALAAALEGKLPASTLQRMAVHRDGELLTARVLNDVLFTHGCPASTSRYRIALGDQTADHRSSGVWVGPAAGSTAAIRSAGGVELPADDPRLQFVVREPYTPPGHPLPPLCRGFVEPGRTLWIRSRMEEGMLYVDGAHRRFAVPYGCELGMQRSEQPLTLLRRRD